MSPILCLATDAIFVKMRGFQSPIYLSSLNNVVLFFCILQKQFTMINNGDLESYILDAIFNGTSWTTGTGTQDFWPFIQRAKIQNMSLQRQQMIAYLQDMENAMSTSLISSAVLAILLLTIAFPYKTMTVVIICKNTRFWTQINAILALNSIMQVFSSIPLLFFTSGSLFRAIHTYTMESEDLRNIVFYGAFWLVSTTVASSLMW